MTIKVTRPQIDLREEVNKALTTQTLENQDATVKSLVSKGGLSVGGTASADQYLLDAIEQMTADTAIDVFVYDTRKDSDGGAWRERTQRTSWYRETLNTATRGSRREFPSVAVIVSESDQVTIYDGDNPDMPMWIVFNQGGSWSSSANMIMPTATNPVSVNMLNGILSIAYSNGYGVGILNFISESKITIFANNVTSYNGNVSQRNSTKGHNAVPSDTRRIVNSVVNDVAMTVLPNAPIDSVTGLSTPTIAVATDGGTSVIKDDKTTVVDITVNNASYTYARRVNFLSDNSLGMGIGVSTGIAQESYYIFNNIPASDNVITVDNIAGTVQNVDEFYAIQPPNGVVDLQLLGLDTNRALNSSTGNSFGSDEGLSIIDRKLGAADEGMVAYIASDYNTGWMPGATKLAALSSIDDTTIDGSNLVTGDAASDDSNSLGDFSAQTNGTVSINTDASYVKVGSRSINIIATQAASGARFYKSSFLTVGKTYVISGWLNASNGDASSKAQFYVGGTDGASNYGAQDEFCIVADTWNSFSFTFIAETEHLSVSFVEQGSGNDTNFYLDGFEVHLADENRTEYTHALQSNGAITKTPVAEGAELMAYSGFTAGSIAGNYLQQGFDTTHSVGTGDFYYSFWINASPTANETFLDHSSVTDTTDNPRLRIHAFDGTTGVLRVYIADGSLSALELPSNAKAATNTWNQITVIRTDGVVKLYINGEFDNSASWSGNMTRTGGQMRLGLDGDGTDALLSGSLSLLRYGSTAPTAEQIKKIYADEKHLFQEDAKATLYGSSDAVTALAYDDDTELLHAGTSAGRSDFHGLSRVNNTTIAITTAISASNGLVTEE